MMSIGRLALSVLVLAFTACGARVDCEKLCARTLACAVTFKVETTTSPAEESTNAAGLEECTAGCENDPRVTVEAASCIDDLEVGDPSQCQVPVLACLDLKENDPD